uniref:Putative secreted protein n=1 Tax=Anopheles darlingi TaxID=43151 RepID=A0A2M4D3T3_ANODA
MCSLLFSVLITTVSNVSVCVGIITQDRGRKVPFPSLPLPHSYPGTLLSLKSSERRTGADTRRHITRSAS